MAHEVTATAFVDQDTELASWFHAGVVALDLAEVEQELATDGPEGAFILRDIEAAPECFGIEYKLASGEVTGALIEAKPDGSACRVRGVESKDEEFQTIWELLTHYSREGNPVFGVKLNMRWMEGDLDAPERRGSISSVRLEPMVPLTPEYDHGNISEQQAEELLFADDGAKRPGHFLVRDGTSEHTKVVSVVFKGKVAHQVAKRKDENAPYKIAGITTTANSVGGLVDFLRERRKGWPVALTSHVPVNPPEVPLPAPLAAEPIPLRLIPSAPEPPEPAVTRDDYDSDLSDWENEGFTRPALPSHMTAFRTDDEKFDRLDRITTEKARLQASVAEAKQRLRTAVANREALEQSHQAEETRLQRIVSQRLAAKQAYTQQGRVVQKLKLNLLQMKKSQLGNERVLENLEVKRELARQGEETGNKQLNLMAAQQTRALTEIAANADKVSTIRERRQRFLAKLETQIAALHLIMSQRVESQVTGAEQFNNKARAAIERTRVLITDTLKQDGGYADVSESTGSVILPKYIEEALREHAAQKSTLMLQIEAIKKQRLLAQARQCELVAHLQRAQQTESVAGPATLEDNVIEPSVEPETVEESVSATVQDSEGNPFDSDTPLRYVHPGLTKQAANKLLLADEGADQTGKFLLRDDLTSPHSVHISVVFKGNATHHLASRKSPESSFTLYGKDTKQTTIPDLVAFLGKKRRGWPVALTEAVLYTESEAQVTSAPQAIVAQLEAPETIVPEEDATQTPAVAEPLLHPPDASVLPTEQELPVREDKLIEITPVDAAVDRATPSPPLHTDNPTLNDGDNPTSTEGTNDVQTEETDDARPEGSVHDSDLGEYDDE